MVSLTYLEKILCVYFLLHQNSIRIFDSYIVCVWTWSLSVNNVCCWVSAQSKPLPSWTSFLREHYLCVSPSRALSRVFISILSYHLYFHPQCILHRLFLKNSAHSWMIKLVSGFRFDVQVKLSHKMWLPNLSTLLLYLFSFLCLNCLAPKKHDRKHDQPLTHVSIYTWSQITSCQEGI